MGWHSLRPMLGHEIQDAEEEAFLLFSQDLPASMDLGFCDPKTTELAVSIGSPGSSSSGGGGREVSIVQSPSLLASDLSTGTTGAVLWKVSPRFAAWLAAPDNPVFAAGCLGLESTVLELGCGIAGVVAMAAAPRVAEYLCTDQGYVLKHLRRNLEANSSIVFPPSSVSSKARPKGKKQQGPRRAKGASTEPLASGSGPPPSPSSEYPFPKTRILALDWETSAASSLPSTVGASAAASLDAVLACDCVYNSHLIPPFVRTCAELCRLRQSAATRTDDESEAKSPTLCIVAQQLRSAHVFEEWLVEFAREFAVWRVPDDVLLDGLRPADGFVVHVGVLKERASA